MPTPEEKQLKPVAGSSPVPCSLWIVAIWCPISAQPSIYTHKSEESARRQAEIEEQKFHPTGMSYRVQWGPVTFPENAKPMEG